MLDHGDNDLTRQAARHYQSAGLPVFPVHGVRITPDGPRCTCGEYPCGKDNGSAGKHPATQNGLLDATLEPEAVDRWWGGDVPYNVAIAVPDGVAVIDLDPRSGSEATLAELEARGYQLAPTRTVATGGGGFHLFHVVPPGQRLPGKLGQDVAREQGRKTSGVDVRQLGNYVVAPPSLHASGRRYEWLTDAEGTLPAVNPLPEWIAAQLQSAGDREAAKKVTLDDLEPPVFPSEWHDWIAGTLAPALGDGGHHDFCKWVGGWLEQRGCSSGDAAEVVRRLPLKSTDGGIRAAIAAWGIEHAYGWGELQAAVGGAIAGQLERHTPNPKAVAAWADVAPLAALLERHAAATAPPAAQPIGLAPGQPADDWKGRFRRVDMTRPIPPPVYVADGLPWHLGAANALVGYAGDGKSPTLASLAVHLAAGAPWLGRATMQGRVLVLCFEAGRQMASLIQRHTMGEQLRVSLAGLTDNGADVVVDECTPGALNSDREFLALLKSRVRAEGFRHLLIETYTQAVAGVNWNDSQYADALAMLELPAVNTLVSIHTRKGAVADGGETSLTAIAGTGRLASVLKSAVVVHRPQPDDEHLFELVCMRAPQRSFAPQRFRVADVDSPDPFYPPGLRLEIVVPDSQDEPLARPSRGRKERPPSQADRVEAALQALRLMASEPGRAGTIERQADVVGRIRGRVVESRKAIRFAAEEGLLQVTNQHGLPPGRTDTKWISWSGPERPRLPAHTGAPRIPGEEI